MLMYILTWTFQLQQNTSPQQWATEYGFCRTHFVFQTGAVPVKFENCGGKVFLQVCEAKSGAWQLAMS